MCDQRGEERKQLPVADPPCEQRRERFVVDAAEVAGDVAFEDVTPAPAGADELAEALNRSVLPATADAGVGVGNKIRARTADRTRSRSRGAIPGRGMAGRESRAVWDRGSESGDNSPSDIDPRTPFAASGVIALPG